MENLWPKISYKTLKLVLTCACLFVLVSLYTHLAWGSVSPWLQTDWVGGSGQSAWFNNTKFSTSSGIDTSTTGQLQLTRQTELFSNTGFETDTTGWAQSTSDYGYEVLGISNSNISGYWKLDETSGGTIADSGSHSAPGSYSNVTLNSSTGIDTKPVGYWNGSSSFGNIYSANLNSNFNGVEGSLSFWFRAEDSTVFTDVRNYYLFALTSSSGDQIYARKQFNSTTNILFNYRAGGADNFFQQPIPAPTTWNHIVMTWSGSATQMKIYLNGALLTTDTSFGAWTGNLTSTGTVIGSINTTPVTTWRGNLSHFAVWNTPLTLAQVTSLYSYSNLTITSDAVTTYGASAKSAKVVAGDAGNFVQAVNVGDTSTYVLQAYAYTTGAAVTSADAQLFYDGSTISTTYTSLGSGWYKLSGTLTGTASSKEFGVQVKAGKTVYLDTMSLSKGYTSSGTLTSSVFDAENLSGWGNLSYTTDGVQTTSVKVRTSATADMSTATAFASCTAISSGTDISLNSCVSDSQRYVQYEISLSTADVTVTPVLNDISLSFTPGSVSATTYYVDATTGNDNNAGTSSGAAWQTVANVNLAMASGVIEPGDTVYFKRGETFAGYLNITVSGTSSNSLTFGAYGSGNKPIINASGNTSAINIAGKSYITVDSLNLKNATTQGVYLYNNGSNITISNTDVDTTTNGMYLNTGTFSNISISNSTITNVTYGIRSLATTSVSSLTISGVTANSGTNGLLLADAGTFSGVTISNSTFSNNTGAGISITGSHSNLTLSSVTANSNGIQGVFISGGTGSMTNLTVSNCTFNSNTDIGLQMSGTGTGATLSYVTTSNNLWDGVNLKDDWTGVVIDHSTSNSNGVDGIGGDGDGYTAHNNAQVTIRNSVARNNWQGNVSFVDASTAHLEYNEFTHTTSPTHGSVWAGGSGDFWIYNNVISSDAQTGYGIEIGRLNAKTVRIYNNIVYGYNFGIFQDTPYASTVLEDYNIVTHAGTLGRSGFTSGTHTLTSDPLFTNRAGLDFTLQSTSPAINAGTNLSLTSDHVGTVVPQGSAPDIGAYEYVTPTTSSSSQGSSTSSSSNPGPPQCTAGVPGAKAPVIYAAISQSTSSILLYFTDAQSPIDHYAIEYGTSAGNYTFGATNIGAEGTRTYVVGSLKPNTTYYFRIRGGNGCATGAWSNELSAKTDSTFTFKKVTITANELEDASAATPVLKTNEIKRDETPPSSSNAQPEPLEPKGYTVKISVLDTKNQPVNGAEVTIHSKVQKAFTDKNGVAEFVDVEPGDHKVLIAYDGYTGEQSLNLSGDVKEFKLTITVETKNVFYNPRVIAVIAGLSLVILVLIVLLFHYRKRSDLS